MFKTVLVPTDFSDYAEKALEYVISLKDVGVEKVVLLHAMQTVEEYPVMKKHQKKVEGWLAKSADLLKEHGFEVETRVETGTAYRVILKVAEETRASMIVIGCHGEGLQGVVVGSVADRVTRESEIPVMLVKFLVTEEGDIHKLEKVTAESFHKVLYPTDFSLCSTHTLEYVREFRKVGCKEVVIVSIIDTRPHRARFDADQAQRETEKRLEVIRKELEERGLKATVIVRQGTPLEKLLDIAKEEDISMICIGSTGKGFFKEMMVGSVSDSIVRKAKCPVLVIHDEICRVAPL
jgi:nucleotide-binding universal stress UspA family protein